MPEAGVMQTPWQWPRTSPRAPHFTDEDPQSGGTGVCLKSLSKVDAGWERSPSPGPGPLIPSHGPAGSHTWHRWVRWGYLADCVSAECGSGFQVTERHSSGQPPWVIPTGELFIFYLPHVLLGCIFTPWLYLQMPALYVPPCTHAPALRVCSGLGWEPPNGPRGPGVVGSSVCLSVCLVPQEPPWGNGLDQQFFERLLPPRQADVRNFQGHTVARTRPSPSSLIHKP